MKCASSLDRELDRVQVSSPARRSTRGDASLAALVRAATRRLWPCMHGVVIACIKSNTWTLRQEFLQDVRGLQRKTSIGVW
jgi:hypothetical protein